MHTDSICNYISFSIPMDPCLAPPGTLFSKFASLTHHFWLYFGTHLVLLESVWPLDRDEPLEAGRVTSGSTTDRSRCSSPWMYQASSSAVRLRASWSPAVSHAWWSPISMQTQFRHPRVLWAKITMAVSCAEGSILQPSSVSSGFYSHPLPPLHCPLHLLHVPQRHRRDGLNILFRDKHSSITYSQYLCILNLFIHHYSLEMDASQSKAVSNVLKCSMI